MRLPEELERALGAVREVGRPYLVGGCVRDWLLGLPPNDFDVEVFAADYEELREVLSRLGPTDLVGKSFGVVKVRLGGREYDFSLPRKEAKISLGHRGFAIAPDPALSFAEAAARRDFTVNAIGYDPATGGIADPHEGRLDLERRLLRHVGPSFAEDPLRVLRAFQLASRYDLRLAPETTEVCRSIKNTFSELPRERVWHEWDKWARLSIVPSRGIQILESTEWLEHFPALATLDGCPQDPEWHPEGDVLTHTKHCLDALVKLPGWKRKPGTVRRILTFAVLAHDFGKASTTERAERKGKMRWVSPGHDRESGRLAETFLQAIGAPKPVFEYVRPLVENHMYHVQSSGTPKAATIRRLARRLSPASIEDLALVMTADTRGRPPLVEQEHAGVQALLEGARQLKLEKDAPRPIILGRHLLACGLAPGPHFKRILDDLFEQQLDGAFCNEEEAMEALHAYLEKRSDLQQGS